MQIDNKVIGKVIRQQRMLKGMTQELLSGLAGIARTHLSMIENGTKSANFETICRISAALEMLPSKLVGLFEAEAGLTD